MYQSIDEETDESPRLTGWAWPAGLAGLAIIVVVGWVYLNSPGVPAGHGEPIEPEPEARQAYLRALGEPDAPLRRARLTDFLNQHSQDPRSQAVRAQLGVLDAAANRDWQAVLTIAQDPTQPVDARRAAVTEYRADWGRYLGARDMEIDRLLAQIGDAEGTTDPPDRRLTDGPGTYPGIPDDRLAGGPDGTQAPIIYRPGSQPGLGQSGQGQFGQGEFSQGRSGQTQSGVVIAPRVVRNANPRYPRRARRRGVEATVTLSLNIDDRGRVALVDLVDVDADQYAEDFVKAAERAALRTRFQPKTVGGVAVPAAGIRKRYRFESDR